MNILHITDFHFRVGKQHDFQQDKIIEKIIGTIRESNTKLDFIFFTGDLVFSGEDPANFDSAKKILLDRLLKEFNLNTGQLFICPGNHDVNRSMVSKAIISQIDSIENNADLERFIKPNEIDYKNSLQPLANYQKFVQKVYGNSGGGNTFQNGWSAHRRTVEGKKVGIYCANTSWRAVGLNDEGKLVMPLRFVKEGLSELKGCDFKIILHHHPLSQTSLYNQYELEDLIFNNFNVAFSGHLHKESKTLTYTNSDGILKLASAATLADSDGSTIGFTLLAFNFETLKVNGFCYKYDRQDEFFYHGNPIDFQMPISQEKEKQNKLRQRLRDLYELELENADDLFLNGKTNKEKKGFLDLWTNPVISIKSPEQAKNSSIVTDFNSDDFIKSNRSYLIMGDDKCGKTSLLKKIQLDCLTYFSVYDKLPLYINAKKFDRSGQTRPKIEKEIATYYSTSKAGAQAIMTTVVIMILIDNLDLRNGDEKVWLEEVIGCFSFPQIIICTEQNSGSKYQNVKIGDEDVVNIYFHSLKKKQIRELAEKFYGNSESKNEVLTRINDIFSMLAIPFNFWSVSLFMWVFKESSKDITNDVDLVDLYIESILERDKLIKNKGDFSYEKYKQYLAYLSKFLLMKKESGYAGSREEIHQFTKEYLAENPRNNTDANTVWQYVESKKIVREIQPGLFAFRLNGVFEYFLAHYLKLDEDFRNEIIRDNNVYLGFKNELEMYAGSNRNDEDFVQKIFSKTKSIFKNVTSVFGLGEIDLLLNEYTVDDIALRLDSSETDLMKEVISQDEADDINDTIAESNGIRMNGNCEVKVKQFIPIDENDVVSLERSLYILGRVYKNADDIKNTVLIDDIFDYLVNTTISWGFKLFQSFQPDNISKDDEKLQILKLINLMKRMLPIIVQSRISDMIGANNMQTIIKNKLKLNSSPTGGENQFKKFILLYLLADIDIVNNIQFIQQSIDTIKMPILRYAILMKILYYYNFRTSDLNKTTKVDIEKRLQGMYKEAGGKFNKTIYKKDTVNAIFQKMDKTKMINKNRS
jgi:DNA repair exonuclease SbcCD nuclease subunit